MKLQTFLVITTLFLLGIANISYGAYIANDVVSDYAEVKELLAAFYRRHAKKYGHDYDPRNVQAIAESLEKAVAEDKTEATVNRKLWNEVFENDIILTLPQAEALLSESNVPRAKRQAHPDVRNFWPNRTISYEFYGGDENWRQLIRSALRHVESQVCFKFKENGGDRDGLRYYRGNGCWSNVGRIGGKQLVSIGYGCESLGIVSHETLHALGLWHEQSRDDRDNFISIVTDKITRGTEGNFAKRTPSTSDNLGQPYDLGSVMHYGAKSFAFDWVSNTIVTRDWRYQNTIGQRNGLSFKDAKMINTRYCQEVCSYALPCQNKGYTDPNNCSKCRCPAGYGGTYCETVEYTACGESLQASSSYQTIQSGTVRSNANCIWRIRNPGGTVEVVFDTIDFSCSDPCQSFVEVKWTKDKVATGARLCCKLPSTIRSEGDDILIIYRGASSVANGWNGFKLRYRAIGGSPPVTSRPTIATQRPIVTTRSTTTTTTTTTTTPQPVVTTSPYWIRTASGWIHYEKHQRSVFSDSNVLGSFIESDNNVNHLSHSPPLSADQPQTTQHELSQPSITSESPAEWGLWGEWSSCSQPCGGCGSRTRIRACYGGNEECPGENIESVACNIHVCAKPKKGMICNGRLLLPCDLLKTLKFGSNNFLNPKLKQSGYAAASSLPLPRINLRKPKHLQNELEVHPPTSLLFSSTVRRFKRQTTRLCEKRFFYQCPSALLTINMEYKTDEKEPRDAYFQEYPECCSGYAPYSGVCYKI